MSAFSQNRTVSGTVTSVEDGASIVAVTIAVKGTSIGVITDVDGKFTGSLVIAVDAVGSGVGEVVLVASGSSARQTTLTEGKPVDTVIMAIVDVLETDGKVRYKK